MTSADILHNLPAILTSLATLVTAIAGLIKVIRDTDRNN